MKKFSKFLAVMFAALMVAAVFAGCSSSADTETSDLQKILDSGELVIGITEYEPMNYFDENGELTGFDTEFAQAVCEKLGITATFVEINWDTKYTELDAGSIDCIWNGMTITDEAKEAASVTNAYAENAQVVVMKAANLDQYTTEDSIKDLKIAVEGGSAGEEVANDEGYTNLVVSNTQAMALTEVSSGSADACIIDLTMANAMTGEGTSNSTLGYALKLQSEEYGIAFRKDSDATEKVNEIIEELMDDGTMDALAEKYEITLEK